MMKRTLRIIILWMCLSPTVSLKASPLYYTFEGVFTRFTSYNEGITLSDFDVVLNETVVTHVFEVDFERNAYTTSNSAGSWEHFYSDLLTETEAIVKGDGGVAEDNESHNSYMFLNQSSLDGGTRVSMITNENVTSSWRIQDWSVGQQVYMSDSGFFSGNGYSGAVYLNGDAKLIAISTTNPIPEPATVSLLALGAFLAGRRRKHRV